MGINQRFIYVSNGRQAGIKIFVIALNNIKISGISQYQFLKLHTAKK